MPLAARTSIFSYANALKSNEELEAEILAIEAAMTNQLEALVVSAISAGGDKPAQLLNEHWAALEVHCNPYLLKSLKSENDKIDRKRAQKTGFKRAQKIDRERAQKVRSDIQTKQGSASTL